MNNFNPKFTFRNEHALRRSCIGEPEPIQHQQISTYERPNILKRSSFTPNTSQNNYDCSTPIKPQVSSSKDIMHSSHGAFYHQSNYYVNQRQNTSHSKTSVADKFDQISSSFKQNCNSNELEEKINKITAKLNKTTSLVERHQKLLKTVDMDLGVNYWRNNIGLRHVLEENIVDQLKFKQKQWSIQNNLMKGEVQSIRKMIKDVSMKSEMKKQMSNLQNSISNAIEGVAKNLVGQITQMIKLQEKEKSESMKIIENRFQEMKKGLEQKIKLIGQIKKDEDTESSNNSLTPRSVQVSFTNTQRTFIGDPILLKMSTKFSVQIKRKEKSIQECEELYKIDNEGYLLDWENNYIIDEMNRKIKLGFRQIQKLKSQGILKQK